MTPDEQKQIEATGCRLAAELRELIEQLPPERHRVTEMAQWLDLNRTTCHRVLAAARRGNDGLGAIREAPGVGGIQQWVRKVQDHGADPSRVAAVEAAIEAYRTLISRFGGSRSALLARIDKATRTGGPADGEASEASNWQMRRDLFELHSRYTRRRCHSLVSIRVLQPMPDQPDMIEVVRIKGRTGVEIDPTAMPLVMEEYTTHPANAHPTPTPRDLRGRLLDDPDACTLVSDFSSSPIPIETVRTYHQRVLTVLDPSRAQAEPFDVITGTRFSPLTTDPSSKDRPILSMGFGPNPPARYAVLDVYLHRSLARRCVPSVGVYYFASGSIRRADPVERWYDRIPDPPSLEIINLEASSEVLKAYPRHIELTRHVFDTCNWPIEDFVGHRCLIQYPLWGTEYMMSFDFATDDPSSPAGNTNTH